MHIYQSYRQNKHEYTVFLDHPVYGVIWIGCYNAEAAKSAHCNPSTNHNDSDYVK